MRCGTVQSDSFPTLHSGVLAVDVIIGREEKVRLEVRTSPAARLIEEGDSMCWHDDGAAFWSNRARTVRDVPLGVMVVPPEASR